VVNAGGRSKVRGTEASGSGGRTNMRILGIVAAIAVCLAVAGTAGAVPLSWQTEPLLGYSAADTGDVVVQTGPGSAVTIPHYSIVGDALYGVGGPGVTTFNIGETVANGSGINVELGQTYHVVGVYNFLGTSPRSLLSDTFDYLATSPDHFVMNWSHISDPADPVNGGYADVYYFLPTDVGNWTYTETWTNNADALDTITSTRNFEVVVPEPVTMCGLLLGVGCLTRYVRNRRKA
jgi:hypothetical protein